MEKSSLRTRLCSPCTERTASLTESQIHRFLEELVGWSKKGLTIEKTYVFKDFKNAMAFVNQVAVLAEQEDHHPDIVVNYNKVILTLWTHVVKGLTDNDFILAAKIDAI